MNERNTESIEPEGRMRPITVRISEACRITGIGRSKFYELIQSGDIATIKVGAMTLVPVTSIEAFLTSHQLRHDLSSL